MSKYLLACSIGPIQGFIAAARRTRDFWFGSYLLSEISRAAASVLPQSGLIFPASVRPDCAVANVILAEIEGDPKSAAASARVAAIQCWQKQADQCYTQVQNVVDCNVWQEQRDDAIVEFYSAWVPLNNDYAAARRRVMRLLGARKTLRDFPPATRAHPGRPKSSLDGARETVWKDPATEVFSGKTQKLLRRARGEQLDIVGVVKRLGGGVHGFPSVARVAADPWLRGVEKSDPSGFKSFVQVCHSLDRDTLAMLGSSWSQYAAFPYDGICVYRSRHAQWQEETEDAEGIQKVAAALLPLVRAHGEPEPYLAVLAADGDRMGRVIDHIRTVEEHRRFSSKLVDFAQQAGEIVRRHYGALVYSGGDDVLALVPVDTCVDCARELHDAFGAATAGFPDQAGNPPTLSVGIAIAHFMEPLEDLFRYARAAESAAKDNGRDSLAVHVHPRSGAPLHYRERWNDEPDRKIMSWAELLRDGILPDKTAYDLRRLAAEYAAWPDNTPKSRQALQEAICADALRLLRRKRTQASAAVFAKVEILVSQARTAAEMEKVANEILVARRISSALKQAQG